MSKQASQRRPASDEPTMSKAERRAAAKLAAQKRVAARRRMRMLKNTSAAVAGIAVIAILVVIFGGLGSDDGATATPQGSANGTSTAAPPVANVPDNLDPALKSKPQVTAGAGDVTELTVTTIVEGSGPAVQEGQRVTVNYVGVTYADGKEFDSSWDGGQPFTAQLSPGGLIEGWVKGLVGVTVGSRVQLDIPAEQAYGEDPPQGYPAGDLRFVIDVLSAT